MIGKEIVLQMDTDFQNSVLTAFVKMYEMGYIYKGERLVNWDPHFKTAISDLEVENIEVDGYFWHIKYPLKMERIMIILNLMTMVK